VTDETERDDPNADLTLDEARKFLDLYSSDEFSIRHPLRLGHREKLAIGIALWDRHIKGATYATLSNEIGVSVNTVMRYVRAAQENVLVPTSESARKDDVARTDVLLATWMPRAEAADATHQQLSAVIRLLEHRARLTGSYAPLKVEAEVTEVTQDDLELAEMIRESKAREKLAERALSEPE
jgi:uncharacterized protein YerC